jgi:RNA-directed DNA polymerase
MLDNRQQTIAGGGRTRAIFTHSYEDIISVENLLEAWSEFVRGKRKKRDVQGFQHRLMDNILALQRDLAAGKYRHGGYQHFRISDPKPRDIHKASVRDRLLHHALYRQLYPFFDRTFIADSYSCRAEKGTHRAMNRFRQRAYQVSKNNMRTCWVLKCDIRKFFASIDQRILLGILAAKYIPDTRILELLSEVIKSFLSRDSEDDMYRFGPTGPNRYLRKGLPLGNLTSQLLVNIYMHEFDHYTKHVLKTKRYIRYADDFVILSHDKQELERICRYIGIFLESRLNLSLHPNKVFIKTLSSGVDFLGWVYFPDHRVLRTSTKRRMYSRIESLSKENALASYRGLLSQGNAWKLSRRLYP